MKTIVLALAVLTLSLPVSAARTSSRTGQTSVLPRSIAANPDSAGHLTHLALDLGGARTASEVTAVLNTAVAESPVLAAPAQAMLQALTDEEAYAEVAAMLPSQAKAALAEVGKALKAEAGAMRSLERILKQADVGAALARAADGSNAEGSEGVVYTGPAFDSVAAQAQRLAPFAKTPAPEPSALAKVAGMPKTMFLQHREGVKHNKTVRYATIGAGIAAGLAAATALFYLILANPGQGFWTGTATIFGLQALQVVQGWLPAEPVLIFGALLMPQLGLPAALAATVLGQVVGGMIMFYTFRKARLAGKKIDAEHGKEAEKKGRVAAKLEEWEKNGKLDRMTFYTLAIPFVPGKDFIPPLIGAATNMGFWKFALISTLGRIPVAFLGLHQIWLYENWDYALAAVQSYTLIPAPAMWAALKGAYLSTIDPLVAPWLASALATKASLAAAFAPFVPFLVAGAAVVSAALLFWMLRYFYRKTGERLIQAAAAN